ncbi:prolipoprotein diacylglyceryl transferase [Clostridium sp. MT-14]|uniref:prolipoprotein diacylglyceryl transferase n=1 Tax=Clostridium sp. MT-14 TaxID=3348360 RepID=UPI0035F2FFC4
MRELFKIGHLNINIFGVMVAVGMIIGILIVMKEAKRKGLNEDKVFNLIMYTIIAAIVGARLYYVIAFNFGHYLRNPLEIFLINLGGLSIQGGLIGGTLFAAWYTRKKRIFFGKLLIPLPRV